jgi:hypothetical protein
LLLLLLLMLLREVVVGIVPVRGCGCWGGRG